LVTVDVVVAALDEEGFCIVEGLLPPDELATTRDALIDILEAIPTGRNDFEGFKTQRIYGLFAKTRRFDSLATHPLLTGVLDRLLVDYQLCARRPASASGARRRSVSTATTASAGSRVPERHREHDVGVRRLHRRQRRDPHGAGQPPLRRC